MTVFTQKRLYNFTHRLVISLLAKRLKRLHFSQRTLLFVHGQEITTYLSRHLRNCTNGDVLLFLECLSYLIVDDLILLFLAFVEQIGPVGAYFYCL
jgi:hypothetical protein